MALGGGGGSYERGAMQAGLPNAMVWIEGNIDAAESTFVQAKLCPKSKSIKALP